MSVNTNRTICSLHHMLHEMYRKKIEISRIAKCATQMILSGISPNSIPREILQRLVSTQKEDGGFVANTDTIWNAKLLSFYPERENSCERAIRWLDVHRTELGFGRSVRDIPRIPVSGIAFTLLPSLCEREHLVWLEHLWLSEKNSLTYKASYTLMAFSAHHFVPETENLIEDTRRWLLQQQETDGGFAPWKEHPVGTNIYCTAVSVLGLLAYPSDEVYPQIEKAYDYMLRTQLPNGLWPYHELEDGAAWGLRALNEIEGRFL